MQNILLFFSIFFLSFKNLCKEEKNTLLFKANKQIMNSTSTNLDYTNADPGKGLQTASVWLSLNTMQNKRDIDLLKIAGIQAFYAPDSKELFDKKTVLIEDLSIYKGLQEDFHLALKNYKDYSLLFLLTEIKEQDWKFLPVSPPYIIDKETLIFFKKSYPLLTDLNIPYVATPPTLGVDKKFRRWIYPKCPNHSVALYNFFDPSFLANRVCMGKILEKRKKAKILAIPENNKEFSLFETNLFSMMIRKYGGFSKQTLSLPINECYSYTKSGADFISHPFLKTAFIHSLLFENTLLIRSVYQEMLSNHLKLKQFIHKNSLFPLHYTGKYLNNLSLQNLLIESLNKLFETQSSFIQVKDLSVYSSNMGFFLNRYKRDAEKAHYFTSVFHAMQPGVFDLSSEDIRGQYTHYDKKKICYYYQSIKKQLLDPNSYLLKMQNILKIRSLNYIDQASLCEVLDNKNKKIFCFLLENHEKTLILMVFNFSNKQESEVLLSPLFQNCYAIDPIAEKSYPKLYHQKQITVDLKGLEAKCLLLKKKAIDQN